jgi:hypothetical protein
MPLTKIVSGGQTGVDRGALDAALECDFPCGGWCPRGRRAEDGPIAKTYPLTEMTHGGYRHRTIQNIIDSDGTAILYFDQVEGGTELTLLHCLRQHKPCKLIDGAEITVPRAAQLIAEFVAVHGIQTLNIAGPRQRKSPRAYCFSHDVVTALLNDVAARCEQS